MGDPLASSLGERLTTYHLATKYYTVPRTWTVSLKRPRQRKMETGFRSMGVKLCLSH